MNTKLILGMGVMSALAVVALSSSAKARSFPALGGTPFSPSDASCFTHTFMGGVQNLCSTPRRYCVALPSDSSAHTVTANVLGVDTARNALCEAITVNPSGTVSNSTGVRGPSVFGLPQTVTVGSVSVPNSGGLFLCCELGQAARLHTINY